MGRPRIGWFSTSGPARNASELGIYDVDIGDFNIGDFNIVDLNIGQTGSRGR